MRAEKALGQRIREIRQRHFGRTGRTRFAEQLGVSTHDVERFERGQLPDGELLVRICEITGEDLQWLLTGVAARQAVVISGARQRHRDLLTRLAAVLDEQPKLAAPVEAFLDLLLAEGHPPPGSRAPLPAPQMDELLPIYGLRELPEQRAAGRQSLVPRDESLADASLRSELTVYEPELDGARHSLRGARLLALDADSGEWIHSGELAGYFPDGFGVRLDDASMAPMFPAGAVVLAAPEADPKAGRPALVRAREPEANACRIWLSADAESVQLARLDTGETETHAADSILWSCEVIYGLAAA